MEIIREMVKDDDEDEEEYVDGSILIPKTVMFIAARFNLKAGP